jgi:hypothetical protein
MVKLRIVHQIRYRSATSLKAGSPCDNLIVNCPPNEVSGDMCIAKDDTAYLTIPENASAVEHCRVIRDARSYRGVVDARVSPLRPHVGRGRNAAFSRFCRRFFDELIGRAAARRRTRVR